MNHDDTHCSNYRKTHCPKDCYRAQLTQELKERTDELYYLPVSWSAFYLNKSPLCPLVEKEK